jgi:hypothetical protein
MKVRHMTEKLGWFEAKETQPHNLMESREGIDTRHMTEKLAWYERHRTSDDITWPDTLRFQRLTNPDSKMTEATDKTFNEPQNPFTRTITTKQTQGFSSTERNVSTPISQPDTTTMQDLERPIAPDEPPTTWPSMGSNVPIPETRESHSIKRRVEPIAIKMGLPLNETPLGISSLKYSTMSKNPAAVIPENTLGGFVKPPPQLQPPPNVKIIHGAQLFPAYTVPSISEMQQKCTKEAFKRQADDMKERKIRCKSCTKFNIQCFGRVGRCRNCMSANDICSPG